LELLAHLEAGFDFADEELAFITPEQLDRQLAEASLAVARLRGQVAARGEATDAVRAVLVGRPNTGKSSLFNALAGDRAALVSDHPGTTRDYLTADIELDGVKCRLVDTAGTGSEGPAAGGDGLAALDRAAHAVAAAQRQAAHLEVLCLDATRLLDAWERGELACPAGERRILVLTKCDRPRASDCPAAALETSSVTGQGIAELHAAVRQRVLALAGSGGDVVVGTALRSGDSLRLADECLDAARQVAATGQQELAATEIRLALEELGKIVGTVYTDDILERIFSRFCVGK
jgi:tRNA modification GTPase